MEKKGPVFTANMLGGLSFYYGEELFTIKCNNTSKVMQLFLMLLEAGEEGMPRVQLLESLYGRDDTQDTKNAFRILVFRLRRLLEDTIIPPDDYVTVEKGIYRFGGHLTIHIDNKIFLANADEALKMEDKEERLELCSRAIEIYPFEEWQLVQIDCLLAMNRYKEALKVYEDATTLFFEELGLSPSEKMLARFRAMSGQIHYAMGTLTDIKDSLKEKEFIPGAYYCSYPSFIDSYRIIVRMIERSGQSVFLMLCTLTDSKGNPLEKEELLAEHASDLSQAICKSLRRGDLYTRYSPNQFLVLLMGIKQEDCELTFRRINAKFREMCPSQRIQLRYYVSSIAEIRKEKSNIRFGTSGNHWKKQ